MTEKVEEVSRSEDCKADFGVDGWGAPARIGDDRNRLGPEHNQPFTRGDRFVDESLLQLLGNVPQFEAVQASAALLHL